MGRSLLVGLLVSLLVAPSLARVGGGDIDLGVVTFSHEKHFKDFGVTCTKCHPKLFLTKAKRKSVNTTLSKCTTCHGKKW